MVTLTHANSSYDAMDKALNSHVLQGLGDHSESEQVTVLRLSVVLLWQQTQLTECHPLHQEVTGSISIQATCLGWV